MVYKIECLKALANGFNICFNIHSIFLNAVERLLNDFEWWDGKRFQHFIQQNFTTPNPNPEAFEVLNGEDKKPGRGKTRQWIRRRDEKGYFNNIVKELVIEDTAEYKEMMQMSHADCQRILSYIEQNITRK